MRYDFEWNPVKAKANARKHKVSFERATTVFRDPNALSVPDIEHSEAEERWFSLGLDETGSLLVVCHTYDKLGGESVEIRIISARKANKGETKSYEKGI
jgi:uncharacterized DUF497 family protein